jgi:flagellar motor protein MotB
MAARDYLAHAEEEESYFVSMTDVIIGLLFIFIIMLMFFAMRFQEATQKRNEVTQKQDEMISDLKDAERTRDEFLEEIGGLLRKTGMNVFIIKNEGVLRLPEEILFDSSKWELNSKGVDAIKILARALDAVLPCYTIGRRSIDGCQRGKAKIEAIFIEGHADDAAFHRSAVTTTPRISPPPNQGEQKTFPFGPSSAQIEQKRAAVATVPQGPPKDNLDLSALRATTTFRELLKVQPNLSDFLNPSNKQVVSVSGYGEYRPLAREEGESVERYRQRNRRIDLRALMWTPKSQDAIRMQQDLQRFDTRP